MKIIYLKLENVAGLYVGGNRSSIEINLNDSDNKIIAIDGKNGTGKSVLISSLNPYAHVSNIDERSSISYILQNKDGYKEIHYKHKDDIYIIKHYFKANKSGGHTVKSYFMKNGVELNDNGNVTSFNSLVEIHMGLTQDMMRLVRIGSNVNSFVSLTPSKRKEYIGKLIDEIDIYMNIYKKVNDDLKLVKVLINSNTNNLYNYHISDLTVEEKNLKKLEKEIKEKEKYKETIIQNISKVESLIADNNIDDLKVKENEASGRLKEILSIEESIEKNNLINKTVDDLVKERNTISDDKISIQSKINSSRLLIDSYMKSIEHKELLIKKISSNNDINSLINSIKELKQIITDTPSIIKNFNKRDITSEKLSNLLSLLYSFNQTGKMIYSLGDKSLNMYLKLRRSEKSVDAWLKRQSRNNMNRVDKDQIQIMFDKLFQDDSIITPNCDTEYIDCPYYRFSELFNEIKENYDLESFDEETLRYIKVISFNIDTILNDIDRFKGLDLPDKYFELFNEREILNRLENRLSLFDTSSLEEYLSLLKNYEIFENNIKRLKDYKYQLSVYKQSGADHHLQEIEGFKEDISRYEKEISSYIEKLKSIDKDLVKIDTNIGLVTKYVDGKKYKPILENTIESTRKILEPLENANNERMELNYKLRSINNEISDLRNSHHTLDLKIVEYKRLLKESEKLSKIKSELDIILESVGTRKGIPVLYMKKYLNRIQTVTNNLLSLIYDGNLKLNRFNISRESFEIPYIKNNKLIPDIKYASQSELAMTTMALSFALSTRVSDYYNILLLDEVDSGLDETNRMGFMKMLQSQMSQIDSEQVFVISQNLSQMANIPMDVIYLSEPKNKNKLANVLFM